MGGKMESYDEDLRAFAAYDFDEDVYTSRPVTTYCTRLDEQGYEQTGSGLSWQQYTPPTEDDIYITGHHRRHNILDMDRVLLVSAPADTDIETALPDHVFTGLRKRLVGTYPEDNFAACIAAPAYDWEQAEL